jgi:hypothetical protein
MAGRVGDLDLAGGDHSRAEVVNDVYPSPRIDDLGTRNLDQTHTDAPSGLRLRRRGGSHTGNSTS